MSFGGSNIDPTAWEDRKCKGESRFPAQAKKINTFSQLFFCEIELIFKEMTPR